MLHMSSFQRPVIKIRVTDLPTYASLEAFSGWPSGLKCCIQVPGKPRRCTSCSAFMVIFDSGLHIPGYYLNIAINGGFSIVSYIYHIEPKLFSLLQSKVQEVFLLAFTFTIKCGLHVVGYIWKIAYKWFFNAKFCTVASFQ